MRTIALTLSLVMTGCAGGFHCWRACKICDSGVDPGWPACSRCAECKR